MAANPSSFSIQLQKISFRQRKELPLVVFSFALKRIIFCAFHFQLRRAVITERERGNESGENESEKMRMQLYQNSFSCAADAITNLNEHSEGQN